MTNTHDLEDGFYWVKFDRCWGVVEKVGERFCTIWDGTLTAHELDEIDPRPIKRET